MANEKQVFERLKQRLKTAITSLPKVFGNEAVNFSHERFRTQSWLDNNAEPWKQRNKNVKRNKGRALLIDTGRLRRSIRIISTSENKVVIGTDVPYARIHNYGGNITRRARSETFIRNRNKKGRFKRGITAGRGFTFKGGVINMPKRQFIGRSQALILRLTRIGKIQIARSLK
jgi:phage gpG-like protein